MTSSIATAGGLYAAPRNSFCYCSLGAGGWGSCGCSATELWPSQAVLPPGLVALATHGTGGRVGVEPDASCPPGTQRRAAGGHVECAYPPGAYVYLGPGAVAPGLTAQVPGAL